MAETCAGILRQNFPEIDEEMFNYINGVLESGNDDFESATDIYDAVGDLFLEISQSNSDLAQDICEQLMRALKLNSENDTSEPIKLDAPVQLKGIVENVGENADENTSIWLVKKNDFRETVDAKKLEKAEAKIKAKQDRKNLKENSTTTQGKSFSLNDNASVSHTRNRRDAHLEKVGFSQDIHIESIDLAFGERVLLQGADLMLNYGHRYGLIGRNGVGKTTLLRSLSRRELHVSSNLSILHVEQEVVGDNTPALESVLQCDVRRNALIKEERMLTEDLQSKSTGQANSASENRLAEVYAELEEIEADKAPARASVILAGLGFSPKMQGQCTREFSGGWRMRLALARALFTRPDLLLLDEPTNMLDLNAIIWLENYLQNWSSTLLVVSHDRNFLDTVCTDIIYMHSSKLDSYKGNYEIFFKTKTEKLKNQQREYEAQQQYREHLQAFINRFRYNANRAALVQSKIKILEKLPSLTAVEKETEVALRFPDCEDLSPPILQLDEVSFYYTKERIIFDKVSMSATMQSRIAVVGENGAGKTTLLKILLGELGPVQGLRHIHRNLKLGYFSQHHVDQLNMNLNSVQLLQTKFPGKPEEEYRRQLGSFGVSGELALRPIDSLSGGQKSRVAFAILVMLRPNFLILDEPTNHLDMETIEALGKALLKFQGGVILVSHDERLVRNVCSEIWLCGRRTVRSIEGGFSEYRRILEDEYKRL
ncbi:ATP-binding cassette sub-family F member 3-like isoform X2 [Xenia sp. Carnegie-2017]|uniref:ATP-binding cassette sub-family F member 3-like isoform X2 n=1 Tax=Xenia sp. Carnegie-2017 TaxID=2897299 RepID=UPI001F048DB8|nr:ATP-binding cassette sub-family F member 3-like isoform X2 [Xenia sp. Carnegie-2017]